MLVLVGGSGCALYLRLSSNISSFDASGLSTSRPAPPSPAADGSTPLNVLLIGSDARGGGNQDLGGGEVGGARSDTTVLLHIYADRRRAVAVSFPRDALVEIPACKLPDGTWTKPQPNTMFNAAFSVGDSDQGNPACTQNTVEKLTGLRIDHTVVVDFKGLAAITDALGGVEVCLPNAVYEKDLDPNLPSKGRLLYPQGPQKVSGQAALDYVRLRHGIGDGSDIGRMKRQQAFLASVIRDVNKRGMAPTVLLPLADAATKSLTVDPGLASAAKLAAFAGSLKDIDPANIRFLTTPWRYQGARVALLQPDTEQLWTALRADRPLDAPAPQASTPPSPAPSTPAPSGAGAAVTVLNGTTAPGLAARADEDLRAAGFTVTATGNTPARERSATTVIGYGTGQESTARQLAALFPGSRLQTRTGTALVLTLGDDYAARPAPTSTPAPGGALPGSVLEQSRTAADDSCGNLSYG
nr:hypothetical protein KPHV_86760 [Kitasatospora purpeofusca]